MERVQLEIKLGTEEQVPTTLTNTFPTSMRVFLLKILLPTFEEFFIASSRNVTSNISICVCVFLGGRWSCRITMLSLL